MLKTGRYLFYCLILLFALSGCSAVRIGYSFLDWWLSSNVRQYIDLDKPQRQQLELALDDFHLWHRNTQLSDYAVFTQQVIVAVEQDEISEVELRSLMRQGQGLWQTSVRQLLPDIKTLLLSMSDQQWQALEEKLNEDRLEYIEKYIDSPIDERLASRQKNVAKSLNKWLGKLSEPQLALIAEWNQQLVPYAALSLTERERWFTHLSQWRQETRQDSSDPASLDRQLEQLLLYPGDLTASEYRQAEQINRQYGMAMARQMHRHFSDKQRKKLSNKLQRYQRDFAYLAKSSSPSLVQTSSAADDHLGRDKIN